jgi:type I restriction enzyme S subunit
MILKDICEISWGNNKLTKNSYIENGRFLAVSAAGCDGKIDHYEHKSDVPVLSAIGAQCGRMFFPNTKFTAIKNTITLTPKKNVLGKYIFYLFSSINLPKRGAGQPFISKGDIEKFVIPQIPLLPIQQQIVEKLDDIFAKIDKATVAAEANAKNAEALFQSYLRQVFENEGSNWTVKNLCGIAENLDSKRIPITKGIRQEGSIPYYGASGIVDYVKDFIFDGDILLISEDGANLLARTYPIAFSVAGRCWVNNHAHVVRFKKITSQKFVEFYLNSISLKPYVSGMAQPKLNQAMLNKIPIPFPALDIQEKYLRLFESIKKYTSITMKSQQRKITELESLKQSILKQAFNGELVKAA